MSRDHICFAIFIANVFFCSAISDHRSVGNSLCSFSPEALVAYAAPKGCEMQAMTGGARFEDLSYDGIVHGNNLVNGLGQITDSYIGPNDFEIPEPFDTRGMNSLQLFLFFLLFVPTYICDFLQEPIGLAGTKPCQ